MPNAWRAECNTEIYHCGTWGPQVLGLHPKHSTIKKLAEGCLSIWDCQDSIGQPRDWQPRPLPTLPPWHLNYNISYMTYSYFLLMTLFYMCPSIASTRLLKDMAQEKPYCRWKTSLVVGVTQTKSLHLA